MEINLSEASEPMPFRFRFTDVDGEEVGLDVGDRFEAPLPPDYMNTIGLRMAMMGMRFMGISPEQTRMLGALLLQSAP